MRRNDMRQMHCIVCTKPIPPERKADAVTCGPVCTKARKDHGRSLQDSKECRYCQRPSTPEERARYMTWRKWEKAGMNEADSSAAMMRVVEQLKRKIAKLEGKDAKEAE